MPKLNYKWLNLKQNLITILLLIYLNTLYPMYIYLFNEIITAKLSIGFIPNLIRNTYDFESLFIISICSGKASNKSSF